MASQQRQQSFQTIKTDRPIVVRFVVPGGSSFCVTCWGPAAILHAVEGANPADVVKIQLLPRKFVVDLFGSDFESRMTP